MDQPTRSTLNNPSHKALWTTRIGRALAVVWALTLLIAAWRAPAATASLLDMRVLILLAVALLAAMGTLVDPRLGTLLLGLALVSRLPWDAAQLGPWEILVGHAPSRFWAAYVVPPLAAILLLTMGNASRPGACELPPASDLVRVAGRSVGLAWTILLLWGHWRYAGAAGMTAGTAYRQAIRSVFPAAIVCCLALWHDLPGCLGLLGLAALSILTPFWSGAPPLMLDGWHTWRIIVVEGVAPLTGALLLFTSWFCGRQNASPLVEPLDASHLSEWVSDDARWI